MGERIGRGESLEQILADMVNVAEGLPTTRSVHARLVAQESRCQSRPKLYQILFQGREFAPLGGHRPDATLASC